MTTHPAEPVAVPTLSPVPADRSDFWARLADDDRPDAARTLSALDPLFKEIKCASTSPVRTEVENCLDRMDVLFPALLDCTDPGAEVFRLQWTRRRASVALALGDGTEV